ncbi:MAG: DUF4097 family beta strand repeat-containing protein [Brachybacterium sp.]|nr:DUF4097 family beta strand repeat-containing protein [Brachybacterium sp.]
MSTTLHPPRRASGTPSGDRAIRLSLILIAGLVLTLGLTGLLLASLAAAAQERGFPPASPIAEVGSPTALRVDSDAGDLVVLRSEEAQEIQVAVVEAGSRSVPAADDVRRARITVEERAESTEVTVRQPGFLGPVSRTAPSDVLIVIPADLAPQLDLELASSVGDVEADGAFAGLEVTSQIGDVRLRDLDLGDEGTLRVRSEVGDTDVALDPDATAPAVTLVSDVGDIHFRAPGAEQRFEISASSDVGSVQQDRELEGSADAAPLEVRSSVGDVRLTR